MRILVVGSGGREHALVWKLSQSSSVTGIWIAPGNGGTFLEKVIHVPIAVDDIDKLVKFAQRERIDLVVPGSELPLTLGITDAMEKVGIACFGPSKYCAQLEGSKAFAKGVMAKGNVPCAAGAYFVSHAAAVSYVRDLTAPIVIKADGLAAGKGVVIAQSISEAVSILDKFMLNKIHGDAGAAVVIEEFLEGEEVSFLCFCDGQHAIALPSTQDHKAAYDNDEGPNTGGMGAYSPAPILQKDRYQEMIDLAILPILQVFIASGHPFKGMLYAGLMMTKNGPKVLEYNTRFGDPECQPLLMRLQTPLDQIMDACIKGKLKDIKLEYSEQCALGVVLAAEGYPGKYAKDIEINGIKEAEALGDVKVFHAGTKHKKDKTISDGGRVLCITALGNTIKAAQEKAYQAMAKISMDKSFYRTDIGLKGIRHMEQLSSKPKVAIFMGSASDEPQIAPCTEILKKLEIPFFFTVTSAHRTPERTERLVAELEEEGVQVFICAAGMAAHLAGAVAARTLKPVIGIPVSGTALAGMDALFATVQMPPGFPVATVATDKAGARNAAWLAAQILSLQEPELVKKIADEREKFKIGVEKDGKEITNKYRL